MGPIVQSMKDNKVYYTPQHVNSYLLNIARQMYNNNFRPEYIVGLTRGGLISGVKISC